MNTTIKLIIAGLIFTSAQAVASERGDWKLVADDGITQTYVHTGSIERHGNIVTMMDVMDSNVMERQSGGTFYRSTVESAEYDCAKRLSRVVQESRYFGHWGEGPRVAIRGTPTKWDKVTPEAVDAAILDFACEKEPK